MVASRKYTMNAVHTGGSGWLQMDYLNSIWGLWCFFTNSNSSGSNAVTWLLRNEHRLQLMGGSRTEIKTGVLAQPHFVPHRPHLESSAYLWSTHLKKSIKLSEGDDQDIKGLRIMSPEEQFNQLGQLAWRRETLRERLRDKMGQGSWNSIGLSHRRGRNQ